jgi:hypothetical protein
MSSGCLPAAHKDLGQSTLDSPLIRGQIRHAQHSAGISGAAVRLYRRRWVSDTPHVVSLALSWAK